MTTPLLLRFVAEARELLQAAASGLLALEKSPDDETIVNTVFRSVHTLKGSVGLFDFPAFAKLVHAGEDVLSAVRAGQLALTSEMVDLLLDMLDRVGAWIDDIETDGALGPGADGLSHEMTADLRALLPTQTGPDPTPAPAPGAAVASIDWVSDLPEADRLDAFRAWADGVPLVAIEYDPAEDCFFSGEDPVNLLRQLPGLHGLEIRPRDPWPEPAALDPYCCVLRLRALASAPIDEIESIFRYVIEQTRLGEVPPHHLIRPAGAANGGLALDDFLDEADALLEDGDWERLRRSVAALAELTAPALFAASALRWLAAVLALPSPDPGWTKALIASLATGTAQPVPPRAPPISDDEAPPPPPERAAPAAAATASPPPVAVPGGAATRLSSLARDILDAQRTILTLDDDPDAFAVRLPSVAHTVSNVLGGTVRQADLESWDEAVESAHALGDPRPMLTALGHLLDGPGRAEPDETARRAAGFDVGQPSPADLRPSGNRVLKVDQAKVDALMTLIGELVVSKNSLPFLARRAESVHGSREMSREIKDLFAVIDRLAQEMQAAIMAVRMLPVSEVLDRFPRLVRDVARKLGKQVALVIEGENTAADKNIVEVLGDPLLHIIRNALDHGIESPDERVAVGKTAEATVRIRAFQESDQVIIEVSDDGRGIDPDKVRAAAVAKGVIDAKQAERLSDQQAVNLVFRPGFSTAAQVSDLSGRGVGMDVVVTTVERTGGTVSLTSVKGEGTTARLSLPLSMAVTRVMMVEAGGGMLFGIPMDHIVETVRIRREQVRRFKQAEAFVLRDTIVPLLRLDRLLGLTQSAWFGDDDQEDSVLVVRVGNAVTGLVVDHFREGMDIILKPFDGILSGIPGYAGTALLGDGRVLLVLNLKELL